MEKTTLEKTFEKLCYAFKKEKIDYMIIVGQAVLYYGHPRLTEDIDITLGIDISELNKIIKICNKNNILPLPKKIEEFEEKINGILIKIVPAFKWLLSDVLK